jgi:hypothetical protein
MIEAHTFGFGMYNNGGFESLRNRYVICTREEMFNATNGMFAFSYPLDEFQKQISEYNLKEIKLSELNNVVFL